MEEKLHHPEAAAGIRHDGKPTYLQEEARQTEEPLLQSENRGRQSDDRPCQREKVLRKELPHPHEAENLSGDD